MGGTGYGISAACGKVGALIGAYAFADMGRNGHGQAIFAVVSATALLAALVTLAFTPNYDEGSLEEVEELARSGDTAAGVKLLYRGRRTRTCPSSAKSGKLPGEASQKTLESNAVSVV